MVVEYELADSVARIYLNRPHRLNAVVPELTAGLARYCRERLAAFKVPRFWQPASDLPRTDSERVLKERLGTLAGPVLDTAAGAWNDGDSA